MYFGFRFDMAGARLRRHIGLHGGGRPSARLRPLSCSFRRSIDVASRFSRTCRANSLHVFPETSPEHSPVTRRYN